MARRESEDCGRAQLSRARSVLLPSSMTASEFGKVYVERMADRQRIEFTVWLDNDQERWQTGVALDASASMKAWYGRLFTGKVPRKAMETYERHGWIMRREQDGETVQAFQREAYEDALARGFVRLTENIIEPLARDFIGYLARELDAGGGTTVIYYACGDGTRYELLGDIAPEDAVNVRFCGPEEESFGVQTHLAPALRYFLDRFRDAERGIYLFITDGRLDDLDEVKLLTTRLAREIADGVRNIAKCVLIGVGDEIDEDQMEQLDDLDTGTDIDIWDHKTARDMRALAEVVVELADARKIVAPTGVIHDGAGNVVKRFTDGMPARVCFEMPLESRQFEVEAGGRRIIQPVHAAAAG